MKRKWITWIVLLALAVGMAPSGSAVGQETTSQCATSKQLQEIADRLIALEVETGTIPKWQEGHAGKPIAYYDLQGNIEAHELPVLVNDEEQGYIVIQATGCQIVEFSEFVSPYYTNIAMVARTAETWEMELASDPLYLSPFDKFFVLGTDKAEGYRVLLNMEDYSFLVLNNRQEIVPELPDGRILTLPDFVSTTKVELQIITPSYTEPFETLAAKQLSVPIYYQFPYNGCQVGCTPTAGGTLMGYWDNYGFSNLINGSDHNSTIIRLNQLAGTWCEGNSGVTYFSDLTPAMESYASEKGYSNFNSTFYSGSGVTYSRLQNEIDNDRPLVVNFSGGPPYNYLHGHSNTGIGYDTSGGNYMILQTNLSSVGTKRVLYGSSYGTMYFNTLITPELDTTPPATTIHITGVPGINNWYHSTVTITLSATDDKSGVQLIRYNLDDVGWAEVNDNTISFGVLDEGPHILYYKAQDNASNWEAQKQATFGIDTTTPTTTLSLNHGATVTVQSTVAAYQDAQDTGSGLWQTRFSNNGVYWSEWQDYADTLTWGLPPVDGATLNVYAQVRDYAGNESAVVSDTITLDLTPPAPHSADFRLCATTLDAGGGVITATGYTLVASLGQPVAGDAGFLSNLSGCRPITDPLPAGYQLPQTVIASSGGLRSGGNFYLGDTAGQPLASGAQSMQSERDQLSAGFWGHVAPGASTCLTPLSAISLPGPETWPVGQSYTFQAFVMPLDATPPITKTWIPAPQSGQGTDQATYTWNTPGVYTLTLRAENCGGSVTGRHTLTITVAPPAPTYTLSVHPVGNGSVDVTPDQTSYISGTEVTLTPQPASGWFFAGWTGDLSGITNPATLKINANKTVTATFEQIPPTCVKPLTGAAIVGPLEITGTFSLHIGDLYTFQAVVTPTDATPPITYTWTPTPTHGQGPIARYTWNTPGDYPIALTVENCGGPFTVQRTVTVYRRDGHFIYLPLVLRNQGQ